MSQRGPRGQRDQRDQRGRGRDRDDGGGRGRWRRKPRKCYFCTENIAHIDYKQGERLGRFLNDRGKIKPRRQTGTCARHQRKLARAIKRARHLAMLPFTGGSAR